MTRHPLFLSSVQKEFAAERLALRDFLQGDPLLRRFFEPVLFEDLPASDRRADELYLHLVDRSELYVGLFGSEYGRVDSEGLSPTEREFQRAGERGKPRLIFLKAADDTSRDPRMLAPDPPGRSLPGAAPLRHHRRADRRPLCGPGAVA